MNPSQFLTPIVRVLTFKKIILDSGWPLTEKSRAKNISTKEKLQRAKSWAFDFTSMHLAHVVLLESELQKERVWHRFKVNRKKLEVSFTGVDEEAFGQRGIEKEKISETFLVGFRGRYNLEAGLEILAETTRLCSNNDISFLVLTSNIPANIKFNANTILKNKPYSSKKEIRDLLNSCDVLLGQLSNHPRLNVTIPHKAFEAAIMGKPYLSARASGIQEFLVEGIEAEYFDAGDPVDLLNKIEKLRSDKDYRQLLGKNILKKYKVIASEEAIGDNFLKLLKKH
jgi:glycosyltransferase involved in cell wall biosynthesis